MPPSASARSRRLALLVALAAAVTGCRGCQSDAQRAKAERAAMEKRARESLALLPYRMVKVTLRSKGEPNAPEHLDEAWAAADATLALPDKPADAKELAHAAATWARLVAALVTARSELLERDEDEFPTVWAKMSPPPPPLYDNGLEHLGFATVWFILDTADKGDRVPMTDIVAYELTKATPAKTWPPDLRVLAGIVRGLSFCSAKYHYAAEEELDAALLDLNALQASDFVVWSGAPQEKQLHGMRAVAFFARAWNRLGLERDELATDDLEAGLTELEAAGVKTELNDWGWAVVHAQRKNYKEAAADLERLAASPNLDEQQRTEVLDAARDMREHGKGIPMFLKVRGTVILAEALLARAGGLERLLTELFGAETAKKVYAPIAWVDRAQRSLHDAPGQTVAKGKDLLKAGLERLTGASDAGATDGGERRDRSADAGLGTR